MNFSHMSGPMKFVGLFQDFRGALADDSAWSHGVARGNSGQNRAVRDAKPVDTVNLELRIDDRHRIASHLRGASLVPEGADRFTDELIEFESLDRPWNDLTFHKGSHCARIA